MSSQSFDAPLSSADQDALDALVEAGFDPSRLSGPAAPRSRRIASILGLLDVRSLPPAINPAPPRVSNDARAEADSARAWPALTRADAEALDALMDANWRLDEVSPAMRARCGAVAEALGLIEPPPELIDDADARSLGERTANLIQGVASQSRALGETASTSRRLRAFRLSDLVSAAAAVLIGLSLIWPMATRVADGARRAQTQADFSNAGLGFTLYAGDHRDEMPAAPSVAGWTPGRVWWDVGTPKRSHSANLFILAREGYVSLEHLASPGNKFAPVRLDLSELHDWRQPEEVSYSYRLFIGQRPPQWSGLGRAIVISDRSPVVARARRGERLDPSANSLNHRGAGQFVLRADRSVEWLSTPLTDGGDNIWLPASLEDDPDPSLTGRELPSGLGDAFMGP